MNKSELSQAIAQMSAPELKKQIDALSKSIGGLKASLGATNPMVEDLLKKVASYEAVYYKQAIEEPRSLAISEGEGLLLAAAKRIQRTFTSAGKDAGLAPKDCKSFGLEITMIVPFDTEIRDGFNALEAKSGKAQICRIKVVQKSRLESCLANRNKYFEEQAQKA
tara:strand:- start:7880 stop:8374 length:495 start_codon:yes stop_codon:yes gene_type:complete